MDKFTIEYKGEILTVIPMQREFEVQYHVKFPAGTKTLFLFDREGSPDPGEWCFMGEPITQESLDIGRLIEQKES